MVTAVPLKVAIEKLRGFVADHSAEIKSIEDSRILMHVQGERSQPTRRAADRSAPLIIELSFAEEHMRGNGAASGPSGTTTRTKIRVVMRPRRNRDRRRAAAVARARQLLASLRSYLMAADDRAEPDEAVVRRATHMVVPWLLNRD